MAVPSRLAELVRLDAVTYDAVGPDARERVSRRFAEEVAEPPPVDGYEGTLTLALVAVGARDAAAFAPLVRGAAAQVAALDATAPDGVQPHLDVAAVLNLLEVQGVPTPSATWATVRRWLVAMPTEGLEPEAWHWRRGLAALALGDRGTARAVAALPSTGPTGVDPAVDPGWGVQAWLALLVAAVEEDVSWASLAPRWAELLDLLPVLVELGHLAESDVAWVGRILLHDVLGRPVAEVADWVHAEAWRVAALRADDVAPSGPTRGARP